VIRNGFGPEAAEKAKSLGERGAVNPQTYAKYLRRAQHKVERRHLRDRMVLLHHEKERKKMQQEMGQDPYLDTPD
jgi:preprotein translocase subunit SecA